MKILAIGPFLGSFKEEIFTFRPYARWLSEVIEWDKIYLSTHLNRVFLYDFVPEENILPVYQQFSRDEKSQDGYVHKKLSKKDFKLILKTFKDKIMEIEGCSRKDIEIHHLSYSKNTPPYSIYNKIFHEIPKPYVKIPESIEDTLVFIPSKEERIEKLNYVYKYLRVCYDRHITLVGGVDTWFSKDNIVLNKLDYFENGWKYIIGYIARAKGVICPLGYWTGIANLQSKPVFSWGENPSIYREGGIYNFGNRKCHIIPSDDETSPEVILNSMESFIKSISLKKENNNEIQGFCR